MSELHGAGPSRLMWQHWTFTCWLSFPLAFVTLPSPGSPTSFSVRFASSVLALVSLHSFLSLNLISEISYMFSLGNLIFHLIMTPKCVLLALALLSFTVYVSGWLTGILNPLFSRVVFISFPPAVCLTTDQPSVSVEATRIIFTAAVLLCDFILFRIQKQKQPSLS